MVETRDTPRRRMGTECRVVLACKIAQSFVGLQSIVFTMLCRPTQKMEDTVCNKPGDDLQLMCNVKGRYANLTVQQ